jgi:hypothetical protein
MNLIQYFISKRYSAPGRGVRIETPEQSAKFTAKLTVRAALTPCRAAST